MASVDEKVAATSTKRDSASSDTAGSIHIDLNAPKQSAASDNVPPVGFFSLFRFSTRLEIFLDLIGIVCAVAAGAAQPMMSLLFGRLTNSFVTFGLAKVKAFGPDADEAAKQAFQDARATFRSEASKDASYLVYIGIGMFVATYAYMLIWVWTGEVNSRRIRERYLKAVLRQDVAYFDNLGAGEVATRIQTDTHLIQQGISEKVAIVCNFTGSFAAGFILAYVRSWRLALALSAILPCIGITGALMQRFISKYMQLSLRSIAEGGSFAEEVISTIRTAQAFGTQKKLSAIYDTHVETAFKSDLKAAIFNGGGLGVFFFVIYSAYALSFSFGTTLVLEGHGDVGTVVNVFLAILIGSFSLALLAPEMQAITHAQGAAAKIFATIDRVPTIDSESEEGLRPAHVTGLITLHDVRFHYPSRPDVPILKGLDLTFPAGSTSALVGASGSGKSTIVSLVERFYDPISGSVKLDGVDMKELNVRWLRSQIGLVSQEPTLFATTIRGNVAHGLVGSRFEGLDEEKKFEMIKAACVKANADSFISKLPDGYDTMVGERGFLLSGGQKQRIAIARAIVSDPAILLLDEATSALDTQSEGIVQDALNKASQGRTTITIAHRLSTIKDAQKIYVMGDGLVLESGTHNELLENSEGAYTRLVNTQKLREQRPDEDVDSLETAAINGGEPGQQPALDHVNLTEQEVEQIMEKEVPLGRVSTTGQQSIASEVLKRRAAGQNSGDQDYSVTFLFKRMGRINREDIRLYFYGAFFATLTGLVYPAFGIVYGGTIEDFQETDRHKFRKNGDRNALWFFLISIISAVTIGCQNYLFGRAASTLTRKLRSLSFKAILRQDIGWFDDDKHSTGSLVSSLSDAPQKVYGLAGVTLGAIVQSISTIIAGIIVGLVYGWKLALVGIATEPFVVSVGYIRLRVVVLKDQVNKRAHEDSAQVACEAAGAIRTVSSLTREQQCYEEYSQSLEIPMQNSNRSAVWANATYAVSQSMTFFAIALVFWYGSRLVSDNEYSTRQFFICLMSVTFGAIQAGNVFTFVPDISSARGAASDMVQLMDSVPEIDGESEEGKRITEAKGLIEFKDVHFRYPTRPSVRVLRSLNLTITPGSYVAIVGASGSGKSTTIQLIERFYDPLAGTVLLDGQDISTLNVQDYRKQLALVSQEPTLYAGTVRFNILLGATKPAEEVTQDEIDRACKDANIYDFIMSLPKGYETEVGGKGSQLSGGQKQRIAIARALLRNPKVLLLDEATSALDSNSEKIVQEALDNAAKGRTTIAIAHRLSTIQNADCIYYIKDGRVSESGTHDELLRLKGGYYELVQLQALSKHE